MMSAKSTTIDVGAGLSNKLAWHTENSQSKPALRLGFIKVNQPDMISPHKLNIFSSFYGVFSNFIYFVFNGGHPPKSGLLTLIFKKLSPINDPEF